MAKQVHVGARIKQEMLNAKMTVRDVAKHLDISRAAVYDIFKREDVSTSLLRQFSTLFHVPMSIFVEESLSYSSSKINNILVACRDLNNEYKHFDATISKLFDLVKLNDK